MNRSEQSLGAQNCLPPYSASGGLRGNLFYLDY
ncbi:hypothetical protein GDO81_020722 [Engystomops pustulosus]|uniref:Uncharacterized protein n=1 Tax=Engystomops pustulosus TaxID=76066 RepID=A0AAV6ZBG4_ENGPU|nr:hypothetical protein GDO81_020722 [Engystomops pustulosus]